MVRDTLATPVKTYDINTSGDEDLTTSPPTPHGATYRPLRYTEESIRIGVWLLLSTRLGAYRLDVTQGTDYDAIMASGASDAERSATVAEIINKYPGVIAITDGPNVTVDDGSITIDVAADTDQGPIDLVAGP